MLITPRRDRWCDLAYIPWYEELSKGSEASGNGVRREDQSARSRRFELTVLVLMCYRKLRHLGFALLGVRLRVRCRSSQGGYLELDYCRWSVSGCAGYERRFQSVC